MKKLLLATVAILAFTAPSFAQDKTVGQAPPSGASSFYLAQDTASHHLHYRGLLRLKKGEYLAPKGLF